MGKVNLGVGHASEDYSDGSEGSTDFDLNYTTIHGTVLYRPQTAGERRS